MNSFHQKQCFLQTFESTFFLGRDRGPRRFARLQNRQSVQPVSRSHRFVQEPAAPDSFWPCQLALQAEIRMFRQLWPKRGKTPARTRAEAVESAPPFLYPCRARTDRHRCRCSTFFRQTRVQGDATAEIHRIEKRCAVVVVGPTREIGIGIRGRGCGKIGICGREKNPVRTREHFSDDS